MDIDIEKYIDELRHTVTVAGLNHEIWWVYKSKDTRHQYIEAMNRYSLFFQTSIHAHFVATLVALYRLYETRDDTYNIPTLLRSLKEGAKLPEDTLKGLNDQYQSVKPLWIKVNILRNKAFGHRSTAHTIDEVFKEAAVTPNELGDLVAKTKTLLNDLSQAWNRNTHAFNLGAREDIIQLLNDLKRL
jgi:hypothetical protein